jgi:hypothetical protein
VDIGGDDDQSLKPKKEWKWSCKICSKRLGSLRRLTAYRHGAAGFGFRRRRADMKDTGGPAFPLPGELGLGLTPKEMRGMTLRDYFAAKAMQALIQAQIVTRQQQSAETAYEWADAMLAERNKI